MITHFYTIAYGKRSQFHAELFARSLELFGGIPYELTIAVAKGEEVSLFLRKFNIVENHNTEFNPTWYGAIAQVPQSNSDITILIDADIIINNNLTELLETSSQKVCGVLAYRSPFENTEAWHKLGMTKLNYKYILDKAPCPYYINLGLVAMPTPLVRPLADCILQFVRKAEKVFPGHFHRPQFALSMALEHLQAPRKVLPLYFNYPDMIKEGQPEKAIALHLLHSKSFLTSWEDVKRFLKVKDVLPVQKIINQRLQTIYNTTKTFL